MIFYFRKNFNACLQYLHKLEHRPGDFKVPLNKAVVEFCKSDFKKTEQFENAITSLCNQFQIRLEKLDDVNHCVVHYNQLVMLFHQRKFTAALRIMDRIYKFIEPMDDVLARQVSLLAIELQLSIKMPDKAFTLITYMENHLLNGSVHPQPNKSNDKKPRETEPQVISIDPTVEAIKKKLAKYKAKCYLMKRNLAAARKELQFFTEDNLNVDALFLNANYEYLIGNFKEAMKTLSRVPANSLVYRDVGESSDVLFYNNMGVIHHALGKPNLACHYFQLALKEDISLQEKLKKEKEDSPIYIMGGSRYHELMYNLGISLLHAGRYAQAFDCLIIAVRRYHRNSRLWLRIAECCIKLHKPSNDIDFDMVKRQKEVVTKVVGTRDNRKFILTTNMSTDKKYSVESQSYAIPVPTIEFASICLRNANTLIPSDTQTAPVPLFLIPGVTPPAPTPSPGPAPSSPLTPEDIIVLRNGILAASAYVSLCLGDYIISLEHAKNLLEQPRLSPLHKLLGHLYAAESLILLDKTSEAIEHLNPENITDIDFHLPQAPDKATSEENETIKTMPPTSWCPTNLASAHSVLQYNLAVAKTITGQLDQAAALVKQIWQLRSPVCNVPAPIIMLVIYIELQLGHADIARNLIRQYAFQHKMNGV
ncbi:hypothetical protein WA026_002117 [Henosepilachna vigintioctopunctata]|uniref:CCR4-NOT transcription complex subunit 10 n=1 Tax=Henosepilachna vigintioctopunctata TaxID=420089 RepID=A0AAW1TQG1_9CUCU